MVRFDDMIATVLDRVPSEAAARRMAWRQLIDLLAQGRPSLRAHEAYDYLRTHRDLVAVAERGAIAVLYAGMAIPAELVRFFVEDRLSVAAPLLGRVALPREDWLALLPRMSPAARSVLRNRRDLDPEVVRCLASFGPSDLMVGSRGELEQDAEFETEFADAVEEEGAPRSAAEPAEGEPAESPAPAAEEPPLEESEGEAPPAEAGGTQIRDLLDRIESFRERRNAPPSSAPMAAAADGFAFETDAEGRIVWVDGVPRGPLFGQTIAAPGADYGVDGQVAGAFRRRAPFRSARLSVAGRGPAGGDWRISAVPFFDEASGRFEGYRGSARRPRRDEIAADGGSTGALFGSSLAPDSLRQLVHELRTPLNAIQGFADMIEGQMLGPAATGYRARASEIASHARRLMGAVDDLDMAARIESDRLADEPGVVDGTQILCRLHAEQLPLAREQEVDLRFTIAERTPPLAVSAAAAERMMGRLLAATIGLARRGETVSIGYDRDLSAPGMVRLFVSRPTALAGLAEAQLLDPGFSPGADFPSAPALGLGFALRLVSNLARASKARLAIEEDGFALLVPAAAEGIGAERGSG